MAYCEFSTNYLELKPKANPIKLLRFLWPGNIAEGLTEFPKGEEENLKRKGLIFLSLLVQMILLWLATPMRYIGSVVEGLLNFPSIASNQNWLLVFLNLLRAFRGTEAFDADAWSTDFDISWYKYDRIGKVQGGFMKALGLTKKGWPKEFNQENDHQPLAYYTIRKYLRDLVQQNNRTKFIVTGHSLGGALAILFAAILALHEEKLLLKRLEGVYTCGQPRVGDVDFQKFMEKEMQIHDIKYERVVYSYDLVPRVPSDSPTFLFKHFGTCHYYNSLYKHKVLTEEPTKNYFDPTEGISKHLIAIWELIRSFIIPYLEGPEYKESWLLKAIRVFGLVIPGVAAHNPHDYVNATRLG